VLLLLDFDGTVTAEDTIDLLVQAWAPDVWAETEAALRAGDMTLDEALERQLAGVRATEDEALGFMRAEIELRPGLPGLVAFCLEHAVEPVIVSSGFHEVIQPILAWHDVELPVVAHRVTFSAEGGRIAFLDRDVCTHCGEACKRADAARLAGGREIAYVGDGWSDRCAALDADLVFARDALAAYLTELEVPFLPFESLADVQAGLARYLGGR
jgi:2-hydroxy-3-keto-5-methylthiopentenyl-1-phosphate phosphatase